MKLRDYLDENGVSIAKFARLLDISTGTINNILDGERDLRLSIAVRIESFTKNQVKCKDLLPEKFTKKHRKKLCR